MDIQSQVRSFITTNFYVPEGSGFTDDASLLDQGVIDSTGVIEVIDYLESTFGIKVADNEMLPENLDSINRIVSYVTRKRTSD